MKQKILTATYAAQSELVKQTPRIKKIVKKAASCMPSFVVPAFMVLSNISYADENGKTMFGYVIKILGAFAMAGGALMAVMGGMAYAEAKSEGEGPAMAKAKNQLTAAVLLILMGVFLTAADNKLANLVADIDLTT